MESDISWNLCGRAAAHQAPLRPSVPTEPHLKMPPGKAEKGEMKDLKKKQKKTISQISLLDKIDAIRLACKMLTS